MRSSRRGWTAAAGLLIAELAADDPPGGGPGGGGLGRAAVLDRLLDLLLVGVLRSRDDAGAVAPGDPVAAAAGRLTRRVDLSHGRMTGCPST